LGAPAERALNISEAYLLSSTISARTGKWSEAKRPFQMSEMTPQRFTPEALRKKM